MKPQQILTPEAEAEIRDHVSVNREALRRAVGSVVRATHGLIVGDVAVGLDPTVEDPMRRWWAKVRLQGGRAGVDLYAEHHPSALAALDELGQRIRHHLLQQRRRRR